jgi:TIR domain-containing protein/HEAT repeat protein
MIMGWRVFYSYSHKDAELRDRLGTYLAPLVHQRKIVEWHDRKIEPGANWETEISSQLEFAHLILLLVSADFLASEYCFGVEVETALTRLKRGEVKVVPVLLKPCLWKESRFSELQIIPREAKAITSWTSPEEALSDVADEISKLVSAPPPSPPSEHPASHRFDSSLDLVRRQVCSYAHLYERTRQRMRPSHERTYRMEQIFEKMRVLATASYPLLDELASSPSPGERLAAVAILQVFATEQSLPFLVKLVGSEKPFVGYHAVKALHFAAGSSDPRVYPQLLEAIRDAQSLLNSADVGFDTDRQTVLRAAEQELRANIESLSVASVRYD